ncbi:MAG: hypothetical protein EOP20_13530, partial [Hyphomicrobiales bacterium]
MPTSSTNLEDIKLFLNYAMSSEQVAAYADTTGYVPSRASAIPLSETYGKGGAGEIFAKLAECCAVVRPVSSSAADMPMSRLPALAARRL